MTKQKYSLRMADPPWSYGNTISNGAAADHYSTMKLIDIKRLPVWELAAENSVLAMWYTGTHNQEAIELAEAWGFTVRTMKGFTWVKLNQNAELRINKALAEGEVTDFYDFLDLLNAETRMNGGNHTRANTEDLLIATRGNPLSPLLDYCNDAAAAWPIIVDNRISIINLEADEWGARGVADCRSKRAIHQNSLRAAMMVYLQMQESANVQDNPDG